MVVRLKQLRNKYNLTMQQLADMVGVSSATISNYENDKREPSHKILSDLASVFGVSVDYLLGRTDDAGASSGTEAKIMLTKRERSPKTDKLGAGLALHLLKNTSYEDLTEAQKRAVYDFAMNVLEEHDEGRNS